MTRNQWLILGSLVMCLVVCVGVLSFLLGAYIFQRPNSIAVSNPTPGLQGPPQLFIPTLVRPATATRPEPSRVYHLNDVVTDQGWEYTVTKVEKSKTYPYPKPLEPKTLIPAGPAQGIYVAAYLTTKNVSKQDAILSSLGNFEIIDATGTSYALDVIASSRLAQTQNLKVASVPGIVGTTVLLFDVNPSATGLKLHMLSSPLYVALE